VRLAKIRVQSSMLCGVVVSRASCAHACCMSCHLCVRLTGRLHCACPLLLGGAGVCHGHGQGSDEAHGRPRARVAQDTGKWATGGQWHVEKKARRGHHVDAHLLLLLAPAPLASSPNAARLLAVLRFMRIYSVPRSRRCWVCPRVGPMSCAASMCTCTSQMRGGACASR
jgi:hypothetical protein